MTNKLRKAIEVLKMNRPLIGRIGDEVMEAIDTVVSHYEKSGKIEFLKSAKQPSEITHPYDLSKNRSNGMTITLIINTV